MAEIYRAPRALLIGTNQYPKSLFSNKNLMSRLGILPVRRVQVNSPENPSLYTSSEEYTVQQDHVLLTVTWAKRTGEALQNQIARMKAELKTAAFGGAQAKLQEMKAEQFKLFLTPEETQGVQDELDAELARIDALNPQRR